MKKLLGISLVAVLAATPLMAGARNLTSAEWAHAASGDNDSAMATVSYVKGAYTELGTVIDTKADETALTAETNARTQADTEINNKIGTTTYTGGTLTAAIAQLQSDASGLGSNKVDQEGNFTADTNSDLIQGKTVVAAIQDIATQVDSNEDAISAEVTRATGVEGALGSLTTTAQNNLVAAINEVDAHADANATAISNEVTRATGVEGALGSLTTTAQNNLVAAINEVDSHADANATAISNEETRAKGVEAGLAADIAAINTASGALTADGHYILQANSVSANLQVLDNQAYTNAGNISTNAGAIATINNKQIPIVTSWTNGTVTQKKISELDDYVAPSTDD